MPLRERAAPVLAQILALLSIMACYGSASAEIVRDLRFGDGGMLAIPLDREFQGAQPHLAAQADQRLVLGVVSTYSVEAPRVLLAGVTPSGERDMRYAAGGVLILPLRDRYDGQAVLDQLLALPDGGLLVVAQIRLRGIAGSDAVLYRVDADGAIDTRFNGGRPLVIRMPQRREMRAFVHGDGFLLAAISGPPFMGSYQTDKSGIDIVRIGGSGVVDPRFGNQGRMDEPEQAGRFGDVLVLPDGRFQILHAVKEATGVVRNRWRRYGADGRLDSGYGTVGGKDIGETGDRLLVRVFDLGDGRHAALSSISEVAGYLDSEGLMAVPFRFFSNVRTVQRLDRGLALVGAQFGDFGGVPPAGSGAWLMVLDATGAAEPDAGELHLPGLRITPYNLAVDSPTSFAAVQSGLDGFVVFRFRIVRGYDNTQTVPALSNAAALLLALALLGLARRRIGLG